MSNFFLRLAQRTLGKGDAVRPLVPSRYANVAPDTVPEEIVSDGGMANDMSDRQRASAPAAVRGDDPVHAGEKMLPRAAPASAKSPATADTDGLPRRPDHGTAAEPISLTGQVAVANDVEPRPQRPTRAPVAPSVGPPHARPTGRPVSTDDAGREPSRADAERHRLPGHEQAQDTGETGTGIQAAPIGLARRSRHVPHGHVETGILPAPMPDEDRQPARARHDRADSAPRAPAGDPVIEVHIGRIEVYAAQPPAPAGSEAPTSPRLSLADYLEMRDGGRR
jgi:hypothetical protein